MNRDDKYISNDFKDQSNSCLCCFLLLDDLREDGGEALSPLLDPATLHRGLGLQPDFNGGNGRPSPLLCSFTATVVKQAQVVTVQAEGDRGVAVRHVGVVARHHLRKKVSY